ncbi:uncharacterized protein LOC130589543 [Beta vulgaris subsp. vulgaris]|uniref:uncharacterized protein LOC130589543 n=1 Tax=Beta vulgaris subsp. vulgaris TaxID=3555 RepID=UPI0025471211|nr:uncharacterized protein LOC130589543 [Beta vulgaris subsp. vulgaris]
MTAWFPPSRVPPNLTPPDEHESVEVMSENKSPSIDWDNENNNHGLQLGPFGGQLLVAVGRDGNNQMFPIAWAVMEVESTESWTWFLELLASDLGTNEGAGYTIMSDQQKGLINAVSSVFPQAESRVCARHVYCNFRTVFGGGMEFRKQFWIIAKSTTENEFKAQIKVMRGISNAAAEDLLKRNYRKWCRAFYTSMSSCDSVDNNMSEVFNAYIFIADISLSLQCFKILGSCNAWQVSGIPCKHAVVAIWNKVDEPEQYVNDYFRKGVYMKGYEYLLEPLNGPQEWPDSDLVVIAPALKKVQHRPQTKRRLQVGEVTKSGKMKKVGTVMTCSLCGIQGHNKRGCKNVQTETSRRSDNGEGTSHTNSASVPMHNRGVGVYTFPNGYQRQASVSHVF